MTAGVSLPKDAPQPRVPMRAEGFASDDPDCCSRKVPELLVGDQIDKETPRRFVLVEREQAIADAEADRAAGRSDHLFLAPASQPWPRSSAAPTPHPPRGGRARCSTMRTNAVVHWPVQDLRARFEANALADGLDPALVLASSPATCRRGRPVLGSGCRSTAGWQDPPAVRRRHHSRELRRVVEFLNLQMQPAEVLAIELRQYQGAGLRTLVPMVIGQTEAALQGKSTSSALPKRQWDEAAILAKLGESLDEGGTAIARKLVDWMKRRATRVVFNTNPSWGSIGASFSRDGIELIPLVLWTDTKVCVQFQYMIGKPVVGEPGFREELRQS